MVEISDVIGPKLHNHEAKTNPGSEILTAVRPLTDIVYYFWMNPFRFLLLNC